MKNNWKPNGSTISSEELMLTANRNYEQDTEVFKRAEQHRPNSDVLYTILTPVTSLELFLVYAGVNASERKAP